MSQKLSQHVSSWRSLTHEYANSNLCVVISINGRLFDHADCSNIHPPELFQIFVQTENFPKHNNQIDCVQVRTTRALVKWAPPWLISWISLIVVPTYTKASVIGCIHDNEDKNSSWIKTTPPKKNSSDRLDNLEYHYIKKKALVDRKAWIETTVIGKNVRVTEYIETLYWFR